MSSSPETQPDIARLIGSLAPPRLPDAHDVATARARLEWRRAHAAPTATRSAFAVHVSTPWRVAAGGLAAALVLSLVIAFTPEGSSAAAAFLAQFRSQQVSAIEITPQSQADIMRSINALNHLGSVQMPSGVSSMEPATMVKSEAAQSRTVSAADATRTLGFALSTPDPTTLPPGTATTPTIRVAPAQQIRFTFDKARAQAYYASTGHPEVNMPDKFNGATLSVSLPAAAILNYSAGGSSRQDVVVAEAGELVVDVQGNVSLPELRDFLLSLPGLPPTVVSQLRQIQSWNDTLPIPVPVDQVHWETVTINGSQGLLLDDNSGIGSAAVWHANNHLYGVAGSIKARDLQKIANSLQVR